MRRTTSNVAHLSASWTRQAGKVRRYIKLFVVTRFIADMFQRASLGSACVVPVSFRSVGACLRRLSSFGGIS